MTRYRERREAGDFAPRADKTLDEMTKEELLELARARGVSPANAAMTKEELKEALEG
jgi:hypothetical protein